MEQILQIKFCQIVGRQLGLYSNPICLYGNKNDQVIVRPIGHRCQVTLINITQYTENRWNHSFSFQSSFLAETTWATGTGGHPKTQPFFEATNANNTAPLTKYVCQNTTNLGSWFLDDVSTPSPFSTSFGRQKLHRKSSKSSRWPNLRAGIELCELSAIFRNMLPYTVYIYIYVQHRNSKKSRHSHML